MGCGCGGVKRSAERVPRERVVGSQGQQASNADPGGFKWSGPRRPVQPEPVVEPEPVPAD